MKLQISVLLHTASPDNFLEQQGIPSYFAALCDNLSHQAGVSFELVYTDADWLSNRPHHEAVASQHQFRVKHVPLHKDHRYWYDKGYVFIAAAKNNGILHADGELLITVDDAEFFPGGFLAAYWRQYKNRRLMHAVPTRMRSIKTQNGLPLFPLQGDTYRDDRRWDCLKEHDPYYHEHGNWCYAGTSFSLQDALKLNGFNEKMDSMKELDDVEFGFRLARLPRGFCMEKAAELFIVDHPSYAYHNINTGWDPEDAAAKFVPAPIPPPRPINNLIAVENHAFVRFVTELGETVANKHPLTKRHFDIITQDTLKHRNFDPFEESRREVTQMWLGTPTFDLVKQRAELRSPGSKLLGLFK